MSCRDKTVVIHLSADDREFFEEAIMKCRQIANQCCMEGIFAYDAFIFDCLSKNFDSNRGKLLAFIDIEE